MSPPSRRFAYLRLKLAAAVLAGAVAFAAPGVAADMPIKAPDVVVVPPPLWSGVYFGLHGGWGWARTQIKDLFLSTPPNSIFQTSTDGPMPDRRELAVLQFRLGARARWRRGLDTRQRDP
jgi:outer membrane immunogenic protein